MLLHEFYFGNLGGDGKASGAIAEMLKAQYGSLDAWEQEFRQTGLSLGGGSGWVVLAYDPHQKAAHTYWLWDHTNSLALGDAAPRHGHVRARLRDGLRRERAATSTRSSRTSSGTR